MAQKLTHSDLASRIVVDGALAHIAGTVQGKMPVSGVQLTIIERNDVGMRQGGITFFYKVGESGVFFDLHDAVATVFFADNDYDRALSAVETAMKRAYPKAKQIKDGPHPRKEKYKYRAYEVDFGNGKLAMVEFDIPTSGAAKKRFETRVTGQARKN